MTTPADMNLKKRTIYKPKRGWKERTYYIVDVAFSVTNVIHRAIFYTGFLNGEKHGEPGGYNGLVVGAGYEDGAKFHQAFYLKPVKELMDDDMEVLNSFVECEK